MTHINLVYLSPNTTGGWVTFTVHLMKALREYGLTCGLYKRSHKDEAFTRPFNLNDTVYNNVTEEMLVKMSRRGPTIIVALQKNYRATAQKMLNAGAFMVVHDPAEPSSRMQMKTRPWVVRRVGKKHIPGAVFIPHPYVRFSTDKTIYIKTKDVVSISRIDFDKNTDIILGANKLGAKIDIYGFENRLYTQFKLMKQFPGWQQSVRAYPRTSNAGYDLLLPAIGMVDMSLIKGDGGGTQYTTLEAWDAGAVPIIHTEWLRKGDEMQLWHNCLTAHDPSTLAGAVSWLRQHSRDDLVHVGRKYLLKHRPGAVVPRILKWLDL